MLRNLRIGLGLVILAGSVVFLVWGFWPVQRDTRVRPVSSTTGSASAEKRVLTLLFPPKIRIGESSVVRLTLAGDTSAGVAPSSLSDHVIVEARFDLPGIGVRPSDLISAPIAPGQTAVFYWTLRPNEVGKYSGTIWLYIRTVDQLTGQENREAISAQRIEIESVKLLGLSASQARTAGLVGGVIGIILSMPFFGNLTSIMKRKQS